MMRLLCYPLLLTMFGVVENIQAEDAKPDLILQIFNQSGLSTQIEYLPETIENEIVALLAQKRKDQEISDKMLQYFVDIVRQSFVVEDMADVILAYLDKQVSNSDQKAILRWLNSKLGRHFTYLETQSTKPAQIVEMRQFIYNLDDSPPSEKRLELITQLNQATHAAKSTLIVLMASKLALELTKSQFLNANNRPSLVSVMKRVARQQFVVEEEITSMVINGLLFTYRSVSDENLQTYINFANSQVGKLYHQAILGGYNSAVLDASSEFGSAIYGNKGKR